MRMAAERDHGGDRHRPMEGMALRQIGDAARSFARRQRRERAALDRDPAFRRNEARERAHERGLAGAIGPDEHGKLARLEIQGRAVDHQVSAEADDHALGADFGRGHDGDPESRRRSRKIIARKNGTPISAVTTPSLSSIAVAFGLVGMSRTPTSAANNSAAPISAAGRQTRVGSEPTRRRTRCGATSPMKPIEPATATEAPTPSATPITTRIRVRSMSTPRDAAASSPSVSARNERALNASRIQLATRKGVAMTRWSTLRSSSEPRSQNAISSAA